MHALFKCLHGQIIWTKGSLGGEFGVCSKSEWLQWGILSVCFYRALIFKLFWSAVSINKKKKFRACSTKPGPSEFLNLLSSEGIAWFFELMHTPFFSWDETQDGPLSAGDTMRPRETLGKKSKLVRLMSPEKIQLSVLRYPLLELILRDLCHCLGGCLLGSIFTVLGVCGGMKIIYSNR